MLVCFYKSFSLNEKKKNQRDLLTYNIFNEQSFLKQVYQKNSQKISTFNIRLSSQFNNKSGVIFKTAKQHNIKQERDEKMVHYMHKYNNNTDFLFHLHKC